MTDCQKCNGTGHLHWSRVDGGICWSCQGLADTEPTMTPEESVARLLAIREQQKADRRARRASAA